MNADKLKEVLRLHGKWLRGEAGGVRADLIRANLTDANLIDADLIDADLSEADLRWADLRWADLRRAVGIKYAACYWTDHGECGRQLLAVHHEARNERPAVTLYYCGCFSGTLARLREYIADGDEKYRASRTLAADFCEARMREMGC